MPWSMNDNPVGWLEITDVCNITCKGCYRLILGEGHKPLKQVKEEILLLKKWRNCDNITISGGEPLLHPDIMEIVQFITDNKMKSMMLSNGLGLTDEFLKGLKKAGLTGVSFHIDTSQTRPDLDKKSAVSELQLNHLRLKYGKMLKKEDMYAHFGITVTPKNYLEVPSFIQWALDNADLINGISLIIYRGLPITQNLEYYSGDKVLDMKPGDLGYTVDDTEMDEIFIKSQEVYAIIKQHFPDYDANSYLGGTVDHESIKWLMGNIIVNSKGKTFGSYSKKFMEIVQTFNHMLSGTYIVYPKKRIGKKIFLMSLFDRKLRKAFYKFLRYAIVNPVRFFYPVNAFGIAIVQAPDLLPDGGMNMCDGCPDMCIHDGKLVYSCRLDEYRKYGNLLHVHIADRKISEAIRKSREAVAHEV